MKKLFAIILVIAAASFCFAACTDGNSGVNTDGGSLGGIVSGGGSGNEENEEPAQPSESEEPEQPPESEEPEQPPQTEQPEPEGITKMYLTINGNKLEVTLAQNSAVDALVEILKKGDITFTAEENGNFEMYGDVGHSLPANNSYISAQASDVILYAGRYLCLFFGNNSYSYTRIGKINGYSASELATLLGAEQGSVQVTVSLA